MKILILQIGGLGDIIESLRIISSIKEKHEIKLVVSSRYDKFVKNFFTNVISWDVRKDKGYDPIKIPKYFLIALKLRKDKFDYLLNFKEISSKKSEILMKILIKIINPKKTAGIVNSFSPYDISIKIDRKKTYGEHLEEIAKIVGVYKFEKFSYLGVEKERNKKEENIVGICIDAGRKSHLWETEKFAKVIEYLLQKGKKVYIFGRKIKIKETMKENVIDFVGKTTIEELIKLVSQCSLIITLDTSVKHIAGHLNIPTIVLVGPSDPIFFKPPGKIFPIYKNLPCSPCFNYSCPLKHNKCMKDISPYEVIKIIEENNL